MDPPGWTKRRQSSAVIVDSSDETSIDMEYPAQVPTSYGSWQSVHSHGSSGSASFRNRKGSARFSVSSLSRRNSSVWLASMSMDASQLHNSSVQLPDLWESPKIKSSFEKLPFEMITLILQYIATDENGPFNLYRVLSTCGRIYDVGVATLYRHVLFRYPHTFDKFRWSIESTGYGQHVRVLDFSAFTSVGLGRTHRMNMEIQMVSHISIYRVLELCPGIYEFLGGESIDIDMSPPVIDKLVTMPVLNTIDFCGANDPTFVNAIGNSLLMADEFALYNLTKLSLHCCQTLTPPMLAQIIRKLVSITRLDLTHTLVTADGLDRLPSSAKLTHLSLARCQKLTSESIVHCLVNHPATRRLRWLNLMYEHSKPNPIDDEDFEKLIPNLPSSLIHLNLNGLRLTAELLGSLNTRHLKSLSIAHSLITKAFLEEFLPNCPNLRYVDLSGIKGITKWTLMAGDVLNYNPRIEMFEFSMDLINSLHGVNLPGFVVNPGRGRRGWIHRLRQTVPMERDPSIHAPLPFSFTQIAKQRMERTQLHVEKVEEPAGPPPASDPIWRFASHKVNVSQIGIGGVPTPAIYGHEGLYNYYSLNNI